MMLWWCFSDALFEKRNGIYGCRLGCLAELNWQQTCRENDGIMTLRETFNCSFQDSTMNPRSRLQRSHSWRKKDFHKAKVYFWIFFLPWIFFFAFLSFPCLVTVSPTWALIDLDFQCDHQPFDAINALFIDRWTFCDRYCFRLPRKRIVVLLLFFSFSLIAW